MVHSVVMGRDGGKLQDFFSAMFEWDVQNFDGPMDYGLVDLRDNTHPEVSGQEIFTGLFDDPEGIAIDLVAEKECVAGDFGEETGGSMGKLVVTEFVTLDGVAQAPGASDEDREGGFEFGGWQMPLVDDEAGEMMFKRASGMDAMLLGRKTYEIFAGYWPHASADNPFSELLNGAPKYVASRSLSEPLGWRNSTLLDGDLASGTASIKEQYGEVHTIGSLDFLQSLFGLGLIDRLDLWVFPVLLGSGKRVFAEGTVPMGLRLAEDPITYPSGSILASYEPAGKPTFETDE